MNKQENSVAFLSNEKDMTSFKYGGFNIRFKSPYSLEYYIKVKKWDNGYIVVDTKYKNLKEPIEEYIDLKPILDNLYMDKEQYLKNIKEVRVENGRY